MRKFTLLIFTLFCLGIGAGKAQYADLLNFNGTNGANPFQDCSLTLSGNKLYGMTYAGGANGDGVIFSIDTNGNFYKVILNFNGTNGSSPIGSLTISGSVLYGMAQYGGANGDGVIFSIDTNGNNYKDLFDFNLTNGQYCIGTLTLSGTQLFGMTFQGGANNDGVIFSVDTNGHFYKDLLNFNSINGSYPGGSLILSGAKLFGMTNAGGINDSGVIFSIDTSGHFYKDLLNFNATNGWSPEGSLILSGAELFGMTLRGGAHADGVIFSIDTNGNFYKNLFNFNGTNGALPIGDLTLSGNILYGMTQRGGATHDSGCIFSIDSNGNSYLDLLDFNGADGYFPSANLTLSGSVMYGMTFAGGTNNDGVIFSFRDTNISTSVNELKSNTNSISIYPNPATNVVFVTLSPNTKQSLCQLYTITGQQVWNSTIPANTSSFEIPVDNVKNGIYFLKLQTGDGSTFVKKVEVIK